MIRGRDRTLLAVFAVAPIVMAAVLVQVAEPFPANWLNRGNPHFAANLLRAGTLFGGGVIIGLIAYTMAKSIKAEATVTGGHPRRRLYRHVTLIAAGHAMLMVSVLFFIRERVNESLSPATPCVVIGLATTLLALQQMIGYQNSRLRAFHSAKQIIGWIEPSGESGQDLSIKAFGATEPTPLREWVREFEGGVLARMSIEKIEEAPPEIEKRSRRWHARR